MMMEEKKLQYTKSFLQDIGFREKDFKLLPPPTAKKSRLGRYMLLWEEEDVFEAFGKMIGKPLDEDI